MRPLQFRKLTPLSGVISKFVVGKHGSGDDIGSHNGENLSLLMHDASPGTRDFVSADGGLFKRYNQRLMKALFLLSIFCIASHAQTPAPKAPAKSTGTGAPKAAAGPSSRLLHPELAKAKAPDLYRVQFTTSKGNFVIEVHRDWAPMGADRFYNLVRVGYFTGDAFYRVVPTWVQFGASPYPEVSRAWSSATIKDDAHKESNKSGTVVFATAGVDKRTTQLFINFQDNTQLDGMGFTPIGTV